MAIVPDMVMESLNVPSGNNLPPTIAINSHAGATATATITGNNWFGKIVITGSGGTYAAGVQATVTFGAAYQRAPEVILMPADATSQGQVMQASNPTTTTFDCDSENASSAATFTYYYLCFQP